MTRKFVLPVPDGLHNTNMDNILADSLPLLTMLACVPVLRLFVRHRNHMDLALYGVGFLLACIYHVCHMDEAGLIASRVFGVSGPVWRSADVYMAQWLLGRMWGHALKAFHPITSGMANGAFPALVVQSYLTKGQVTLGICARMLLVTMALTAVAKVSCEGDSIKHWFPRKRGSAIMGYLAVAFVAFPMPAVLPSCYWVLHSIWHVLLAAGCYELCAMLYGKQRSSGVESRLTYSVHTNFSRVAPVISWLVHAEPILPPAAGCYELCAMLYGEQRSFWVESRLCISDLRTRITQRLLAVVEVSQALRSEQNGPGSSRKAAEAETFQEQLQAERWKGCDLKIEQQLSLFGQAS